MTARALTNGLAEALVGERPRIHLGHRAAGGGIIAPARSLHPLLAGRWSPTRFDPVHEIDQDEIELLLEAARWAPSAGSSQPWAFIVARPGSAEHKHLARHLAGSTAAWAPTASLLVANLSQR